MMSLLSLLASIRVLILQKIILRRNVFTGVLYRDETSIFGWELMNEPRCISDPTGNTLQASVRRRIHETLYVPVILTCSDYAFF